MWVKADDIIIGTKNNKKEDTKMTTHKKTKLTFAEAMTIINNASAEDKIEVTDRKGAYYIIKIDDNNYIVYAPDAKMPSINLPWICNKLHINTKDTYNFTIVVKSPVALWDIELDIYDYIEDGYYTFLEGFNINIDILYDLVDTSNKIELDDKKARSMLTKARFTGCLYDLFDGGYGYTINNNNVLWYIPDDYYLNDEDINKRPYYMMYDTFSDEPISLLDHIDSSQFDGGSNPLDGDFMKDKISINVYAISNKKVFDTDFIVCIKLEFYFTGNKITSCYWYITCNRLKSDHCYE